jgi:CheY-like chemotaxis protein
MSTLKTSKAKAEAAAIHVFVAEDSASDFFWLEMVFKGSRVPYTLDIAKDQQAATEYLKEILQPGNALPDVIILNADLPGLSSTDLLDGLKLTQDIPVFVISEGAVAPPLRDFVGADHCLSKPFTHAQLVQCLAAIKDPSFSNLLHA